MSILRVESIGGSASSSGKRIELEVEESNAKISATERKIKMSATERNWPLARYVKFVSLSVDEIISWMNLELGIVK